MRKRGVLLRLVASSVCALALTACGSNDEPRTRLLDGSPAVAPSVSLDGVDEPAIAANVAVIPRRQLASSSAELECLRRSDDEGVGPLVVSVGTYATSVTFRAASSRALIGCDGVTAGRESARHWCGRAFGLLRHGRLRDPRLDLACDGADGRPVAFAWVEPGPRTHTSRSWSEARSRSTTLRAGFQCASSRLTSTSVARARPLSSRNTTVQDISFGGIDPSPRLRVSGSHVEPRW